MTYVALNKNLGLTKNSENAKMLTIANIFYRYLTDKLDYDSDILYLMEWLSQKSLQKTEPDQELINEILKLCPITSTAKCYELWEKLCMIRYFLTKEEQQVLLNYLRKEV